MESGASFKTPLKWLGFHVQLFKSIWQYHGYYPEETTDGANTWTVIEEIHSFYCKVKCWWALFGCWIDSS